MEPEDRTSENLVEFERVLASEPFRVGFFQAIRRLQALHPDLPGVGRSLRPADDPIRLSQDPFMDFATRSIAAFKPGSGGRPSRLVTFVLGLLGPNGPMPLHITDFIRDRIHNHNDPTAARFLDLFHHRILSLFYRAWAETQPTVQADHPQFDRFAEYVGSLIGIAASELHDRDEMPDSAKRYHCGTLASQTKYPDGLRSMLAEFFRVPVQIEEFSSHWMQLPDECRTQLGTSSSSARMGRGAVLGRRVWECQYKFRIVIGPIEYEEYLRLLPGGQSLQKLIAIVKNYIGDELEWDVNLILKKEERPPLQLGRSGQLLRTAWLSHRVGIRDADEMIVRTG